MVEDKQEISFQVIEIVSRSIPPVAACSFAVSMASSSGNVVLAAAEADQTQNNSSLENNE